MAYNQNEVNSDISNVGQKYAPKENLGRVIKLILTDMDFVFATQSAAETEVNWQNAIEAISGRIRPMPYVYENEDISEEATYQDFTGGDSLKIRDGKYGEKMKVFVSVSDMKKLSTYRNKSFRAFEIDANGNILGTTPDDIVMKGFEVSEFEVEKMNRTIGDVNRLVPLYIKYRDPSEWTTYPAVIKPLELDSSPWDPRDLDGLTDVELTVNTATSTNINVTATAHLKGVLLSGFDQVADWILTTGQTITVVTDNSDGTYDLTGVGLVSGTLNLAASSVLSQDGYESTGAQTVTI